MVVVVRLLIVSVVVVLLISTMVLQLLVEDCHLTTSPTFPVNDRSVLLLPEQTEVDPMTVPPTDAGLTVITASAEFAAAQ